MPPSKVSSDWHFASLLTRGYVELLKQPRFFHDLDRKTVLKEAMDEFSTYLGQLEEKISSHAGAVPALEALHVFTMGVLFATQDHSSESPILHYSPSIQHSSQTASRLLQTLNILTLLSSRYAAIRSLRDIISELQKSIHQSRSQDRLRLLIACSEIVISDPIQGLLLRGSLSVGSI
jgi:hypothetical protein